MVLAYISISPTMGHGLLTCLCTNIVIAVGSIEVLRNRFALWCAVSRPLQVYWILVKTTKQALHYAVLYKFPGQLEMKHASLSLHAMLLKAPQLFQVYGTRAEHF